MSLFSNHVAPDLPAPADDGYADAPATVRVSRAAIERLYAEMVEDLGTEIDVPTAEELDQMAREAGFDKVPF